MLAAFLGRAARLGTPARSPTATPLAAVKVQALFRMSGESVRAPLKVALLGAGGFVKDAYLSPLREHTHELLVTAVWSRSADSAQALLPEVQRCAACLGVCGAGPGVLWLVCMQ